MIQQQRDRQVSTNPSDIWNHCHVTCLNHWFFPTFLGSKNLEHQIHVMADVADDSWPEKQRLLGVAWAEKQKQRAPKQRPCFSAVGRRKPTEKAYKTVIKTYPWWIFSVWCWQWKTTKLLSYYSFLKERWWKNQPVMNRELLGSHLKHTNQHSMEGFTRVLNAGPMWRAKGLDPQ